MRHLIVVAAAALVGACATSEYSPSADGRGSWTISCPAMHLDICFAKAKETCPKGYNVLSTDRPAVPVPGLIGQDRVVVACQA